MEQIDMFGSTTAAALQSGPSRIKGRDDWRVEVEARQPQLPLGDEETDRLFQWSDSEIESLRIELLWSSVQDVCDGRVSDEARDEVWDWIEDDEIWPFSFRVCAAAWDPRMDADTLREMIRSLSKRILGGQVNWPLNEIEKLRKSA